MLTHAQEPDGSSLSKHSVPRWRRAPGLWGAGSAGLWKGTLPPSSTSPDFKQASLFPANPENVVVGRAPGQGSWATVLLGYTPGLLGDRASHILSLSPLLISHTEAASAWPGHHRARQSTSQRTRQRIQHERHSVSRIISNERINEEGTCWTGTYGTAWMRLRGSPPCDGDGTEHGGRCSGGQLRPRSSAP